MPRAEVGRDVIHHPAVGEVAKHGCRVRVAADAGALAFHAQQPHFAAWAAFKEARGVVSMSKVRATSLF